MNTNPEYLTIQELAKIVSDRAADLKTKNLGPIIHEVVREHPYATASAVGKELNLHRKHIQQEEREEAIHVWEQEKENRRKEDYLRDARRHERDMLKGLWYTGHDPDDI